MNLTRTALLGLLGAVLVAWLAGAATSSNRGSVVPSALRTPLVDSRGAALAEEVARLHEHLRPVAVPQQPGRNLFLFSPRQSSVTSTPAATLPKAALSESTAARPAAPVMKLSGLAEDVTADGVVRTAIISAFGQLFVVKEGETVTARYRVVKILPDAVELSDTREGSVLRFALK